jgi:hypothetical protein
MNNPSKNALRFAILFVGAFAVTACGSAPSPSDDAASSAAPLLAPPPLETLVCSDAPPVPIGLNVEARSTAFFVPTPISCTYKSVTTNPNPGTCGAPEDVPAAWASYGCTRGVEVYNDGVPNTATIWACPSALLPPTLPPRTNFPPCSTVPTPPQMPPYSCEIVVTGKNVNENACVGYAQAGWTLVEDWIFNGDGGHLCPSGCPTQ